MDEKNQNGSGYPQQNDTVHHIFGKPQNQDHVTGDTQEGWNTAASSGQDTPQSGWNSTASSTPDAPQNGWNSAGVDTPSDAQDGWNTQPNRSPDAGAPQNGWNSAGVDTPGEAQEGWNTQPNHTADAGAPQNGWNTQPPTSQWDTPQDGWNKAVPRTPYQTPVRMGDTGTQPQPNAYRTYQEWQEQNKKQHKGEKKVGKGRRVLYALGGIVAACAIFAGGALAGGMLGNQSGAQSTAAAETQQVSADTPKLTISEASTDSSNTDSVMTGDQIYEKVSPSVVSIVSTSLTTQGTSSGSGVIMTTDGYVITNAHVISGADKVSIVTSDGMQHNAEIIGSDTKTDLAVLKISESGVAFTPAEFGDSAQLKAGETAYAIGSPGGVELANSITTGSISAINRDITIDDRVMTLIQTDASINPGNSGGALINQHGQVIGITSAKLGISYYEGLGFAIPIDTAKDIVDQLIAYGYVPGRPAIGVTGYNISEQTAAYNNVPQGVLITEVDSRSDAAAKGLQAKDIITAVNGKTIQTMDEINKAKEELNAGDSMTLTVYRISTGETMDITITLADENDLTNTTTTTTTQNSDSNGSEGNNAETYTFPWSY